MTYIKCTTCNSMMEINVGSQVHYNIPSDKSNPKKLIGSAMCRSCGAGTGFEINDNVMVSVSGKSNYGTINPNQPEVARTLYAEAELCFQNGVPNAAATMCRASIEDALTQAGIEGRDLYNKIANAKTTNRLDDDEVGLAHASRLITRDAIHRGELVNLSDIPSMLSATVRILNKLSEAANLPD